MSLRKRVRKALSGKLARAVGRDRLGQGPYVDWQPGTANQRVTGRFLDPSLHPRPSGGIEHTKRAKDVDDDHRVLDGLDHKSCCRDAANVAFDPPGVNTGEVRGVTCRIAVKDAYPEPIVDEVENECRSNNSDTARDAPIARFSYDSSR